MARRTKTAPVRPTPTASRRAPTGRATPKGGGKGPGGAPVTSGRYTPPIPKSYKESPPWVLVLLLAFLIGGMLMILLNYLPNILPGSPTNLYLLGGLGLITCGFMTATRYR